MKVEVESYNESIHDDIRLKLVSDVVNALSRVQTQQGKFIVNDTLWYWVNPAGKIRPSVVNSAKYISKTVQLELEKMGWEKEPELAGQNFDAMLTFERVTDLFSVRENDFLPVLNELRQRGFKGYGEKASAIYRDYVLGSSAFLPSELAPFSELFDVKTQSHQFRVGLEFETGNIASSFRAIDKLQGLFDRREIDLGVFVTSKNKNLGAARIWPVSNRNGSFQELNQRRYDERRSYPHIDISFLPDDFREDAKYFDENGLYEMQLTGETKVINGVEYTVAQNSKNEEKLRPLITSIV